MATPQKNTVTIKYANGKKMHRLGFDQDAEIVSDFKKILALKGTSIAHVLRPHVIAYVESNKNMLP